jgi:hypothetical protein
MKEQIIPHGNDNRQQQHFYEDEPTLLVVVNQPGCKSMQWKLLNVQHKLRNCSNDDDEDA